MMPSLMQLKGRKFTFIGSCLLLIIGWCLMLAAMDAYIILLAEVFLGLGSNCIAVVNLMAISEMLAPRYRTVSMMLLGISQSMGTVLSITVGSFLHWKGMALVMSSPVVIALVMMSLWPESPAWLLYKGKIDRCEKAFTWLRGTDDDARKELQALMLAQREHEKRLAKKWTWQEFLKNLKRKDFYLPTLHMFLILLNFYVSGGICLVIYSKYVMETATGDADAALSGYLMISVTFITGAITSLVCIRYLNSKTMLYIGGVCNIFLLFGAIVTFLQSHGLISKNPYIFIVIYLGIMVCYDSGFNTVTFAVAIELMPVKHRGIGGILYNIITCCFFFTTIKSLPYLLLYLNVWGTFLLFSMGGIICTLLIWRYVPETKGRTLQEIEDYYNYGSFVKRRVEDSNNEVASPML